MSCEKCEQRQKGLCGGAGWKFTPSLIIYCYEQMIFLLENLEWLADGKWPDYAETPSLPNKKVVTTTMPLIKCIYADVTMRLERLPPLVQALLLAEIRAGYKIYSSEAEAALIYISGKQMKKQSYTVWRKDRKYRYKKHTRESVFVRKQGLDRHVNT